MKESLIERVGAALSALRLPGATADLVASGAVHISETGGRVRLALEAPGLDPAALERLRLDVEAAAASVPGVTGVTTTITPATAKPPEKSGQKDSDPKDSGRVINLMTAKTPPARKPSLPPAGHTAIHIAHKGTRAAPSGPVELPGVKHVIAVASGKGGVGKSTVAANLACALARRGLKVGLMDADIYGPSLPTLFGLSGRPEFRDGLIVPALAHGVSAMSIGLLLDPEQALVWRGPMVMTAVRQLLADVAWGEQDVLVVDTPPGTGDALLTLAQKAPLTGAVIVSTPQQLALDDVRRGVEMFRKVKVPVLGLIENMAWFEGADGVRTHIFGEGGAKRAAEAMNVPVLGELPIYPDLRLASDEGRPLAATEPDGAVGKAFAALAAKVAEQLGI